MLGLYGMLNLGARSLQAGRTGTEVTGHNIANANNPAYSRQRLDVSTSMALSTPIGEEGTGVDVVGITQIRDSLLDGQIQVETSVSGSLTAQQSALQQAEAALGQSLDASASSSKSASNATGTQHGLGDGLNNLFNEFQNLANDPSSITERSVLLMKASDLASNFNQVDSRLSAVQDALNNKLTGDVSQANQLMSDIAKLNHQISAATVNGATANDLMDTRQSKIEALSKLVKVDVTAGDNNSVDIAVDGTTLVTGDQVQDTLQMDSSAGGQPLLRAAVSGASLTPSGGSIQGAIAVRDGALKDLQDNINNLASSLITEVNAIHSAGFGLNGSTGAAFFTGTSAADIAVNKDLAGNPALLQASGDSGSNGDNQTALALAQLASKPIDALNGQTLSGSYSSTVTVLGQAAASVNSQIDDQKVVQNMLTQQRNSLSGVSLDEEMTNMITYQKAFEASAKIVSTVDDMLTTLINMKQ